ncbi:MAG: hypothetical protein KA956_11900 [Pyrinomonadaceae bacterium]|nr:arsenate reductase [Acidobacteriota bacterium]MBP7377169.1 hypothetical protein [Pyrinomonadaceae bacterium]MBP7476133.1 hypothetical protein [Pyrinomonadaceae bacterium]
MATLFRENGIDFTSVNYFSEPLTAEILRELAKKLAIPPFGLLRTKEKQFKELAFTPESPENEVLAAIVANPGLLNRPIVVVGDHAVIARPIEKALELLGKK